MKLSLPESERRALALTVQRDGRTVFSDPLSRSLFDPASPPPIKAGELQGRLFEGAHPYLLFCRRFRLRATEYTLYAALPLDAGEQSDPAALEAISARALRDLWLRFAVVLSETEGTPSLSSLPLRTYFASQAEKICASLYAPLIIEVGDLPCDPTARVHPACLSQAIGLSLSALLREGQSSLSFRLSDEGDAFALSFVGERGIENEFVRELLAALAESGAFLVRHTPRGVDFLLLPTHRPATLLRADDDREDIHLLEGFFLL